MNKSQQKISAWQKSIGKTLKGLGAVLGGLAIGELIKDSIRAAMDVQGSMLQIRRTMGANATVFENWAQTQAKAYGMAREEAYKYGATYSNLISSFVQDTQETTRYTIELLQASSVVAEKTGRNVEDVMERIRSGLLGNTEAIEDLGIHVNIAMLESTEAFRLFARGRSWKQLTFQEQQQIRLLSILEQAYVKYGDTLAGTVHTKQLMFISTLKNIRLNLGQAFLPVYNTVLPVLTDLASKIEANKGTLLRWGQSIAGVVRTVVKGFSLITGAIVKNWQAIKFVGATFLTYIALIKGAAIATTIFKTASAVLTGTIAANVPVLSALSIAINTYRLQVALAPVATNIFSAALYRLQAALYAVHAALGPIGWVILAISAAISGGMVLWNKYTQSLQKTAQTVKTASPADLAKGFRELEKSTEESTDAMEDAGKAAGKNLQSFDEIHQLQEDMAGSGKDMQDALDLEAAGADMPELNLEEMLAGLEGVKPTLSGFWEWIKQECVKAWDWIKEKTGLKWWEILAVITGPVGAVVALISKNWDKIKNIVTTAWNGIVNVTKTAWQEAWALLKTYWGNAAKLATDVFGAIRNYIIGTWENIKTTASEIWGAIWDFLKSQWEIIKTAAGNIWGTIKDLITGKIDLRTAIKRIWEEIKKYFANSWGNIKTLGENIWGALSKFFETQWELLKTLTIDIWEAIKKFVIENWENIKKSATEIWEAISSLFESVWEDINDVVTRIATSILEFLGLNWDEITKKTNETWTSIKANSGTAWNNIKTSLSQTWSSIQSNAGNTLANMRNTISNAWNNIRNTTQSVWANIRDSITSPIESAKRTVLNIIDNIKNAFANMRITIPKPKLPHISVSMKSKSIGGISIPYPDFDIDWYAQGGIFNTPSVIGVGEAGPEAVLPLDRNTGWMDTLAAKIAASIGGAGGGDIYVYVGNEQVDAYVYRSQDRRNIKSNGR